VNYLPLCINEVRPLEAKQTVRRGQQPF